MEKFIIIYQLRYLRTIQAHCQNDIEYQADNHFGKKINTNAGTYVLDDNYLAKVKEVTEYNTDMEKRKKKFLSEEKNLTGIIKKIQSNGVLQNEYKLYWYSTIGLSRTLRVILKSCGLAKVV